MKTSLPHLRKLLLFFLLNLVDLLLTWLLLREVNGEIYESNPIADWWLRRHGWAGLAVFKSFIVLLAGSIFVLGCRYRPHFTGRCLTLSCTLLLVVVLYSCGLVPVGKMRAREVQARALAAAVPVEEAERFRAAEDLYLRLLRDVAADPCHLHDAAEQLACSESVQEGNLFHGLERTAPDYSLEEQFAVSLIEGIESWSKAPGRVAEPLADRLRQGFQSYYGKPFPSPRW